MIFQDASVAGSGGLRQAAGLLLVILGGACSEFQSPDPLVDAEVLARVGDDVVTVADYRSHFDRLPDQARSEVQAHRVLQAIIDEKLILAECRRLGLDKSVEYRQLVQQQTRQLALAELYRREGIVRGQATAAELEAFFASTPYSRRVRFLLLMVRDADKIPALMAQLEAGADFEALSMAHSQDNRILLRHADMGYHRWGETMPSHEALTQKAFTMEPGQVAGPLAVADGFFILKVTDVRPVSLEQERETIVHLWDKQHLSRQLTVFADTLMARYEVTFDETGLAGLWSVVADTGEGGPPAVGEQVVARLREGDLTVEACLRLLTTTSDLPGTPERLRQVLEQRILREILMPQEIGRLDLVNSAEVKSGLVESRRRAQLGLIRRRIESEVPVPSLNFVRLHFDANREDYREPAQEGRESRIPDFSEIQETVTRDLLAQERSEVFERYLEQLRATNAEAVEIYTQQVLLLGHV